MSQPKDAVSEAKDAFVATLRGICDVAAEVFEAATHAMRRGIRRSHTMGYALVHGANVVGDQGRRSIRRP